MINVIVAHDLNRCIGKDGYIPWHIKGEQKQFKELTTNNIVIMGSNTFKETGVLSNRNIVLVSRHKQNDLPTYNSLSSAVLICLLCNFKKDIYIAGGEMIYKSIIEENIPIDNFYITVVYTKVENDDKFFPCFDMSQYDRSIIEENPEYIRYLYKKRGNTYETNDND